MSQLGSQINGTYLRWQQQGLYRAALTPFQLQVVFFLQLIKQSKIMQPSPSRKKCSTQPLKELTWKGFSPVCTSWCLLSFELSTKALPHSAQTCTRGPWVCKCFLIAELSLNILVHPWEKQDDGNHLVCIYFTAELSCGNRITSAQDDLMSLTPMLWIHACSQWGNVNNKDFQHNWVSF